MNPHTWKSKREALKKKIVRFCVVLFTWGEEFYLSMWLIYFVSIWFLKDANVVWARESNENRKQGKTTKIRRDGEEDAIETLLLIQFCCGIRIFFSSKILLPLCSIRCVTATIFCSQKVDRNFNSGSLHIFVNRSMSIFFLRLFLRNFNFLFWDNSF